MSNVRGRSKKDVISVKDAVNDFLASADVKRLELRTQDQYRRNLDEFARWCAEHSLIQSRKDASWHVVKVRESYNPIMLGEVNAQAIHLFTEHLQETHKPSKADKQELSSYTITRYVKDIKRFLNWCVEDEVYGEQVSAVTVRRIKNPPVEEVIIDVFTEADIDALFRACQKEESEHLVVRDTAILSLLLDSAIRASELCGLTIGNVDLSTADPHIKIYGKGRKWGEVGFGERARRAMQKYYRQFREPTVEHQIVGQLRKLSPRDAARVKKQMLADARFFVNRAGQPLTRSGLQQLFERLGEWAGIEDVRCSPHTCRHWYASQFMRNGGNIYQLSKILRHSSVRVTEIYLKSLQQAEARRGVRSVLDNM